MQNCELKTRTKNCYIERGDCILGVINTDASVKRTNSNTINVNNENSCLPHNQSALFGENIATQSRKVKNQLKNTTRGFKQFRESWVDGTINPPRNNDIDGTLNQVNDTHIDGSLNQLKGTHIVINQLGDRNIDATLNKLRDAQIVGILAQRGTQIDRTFNQRSPQLDNTNTSSNVYETYDDRSDRRLNHQRDNQTQTIIKNIDIQGGHVIKNLCRTIPKHAIQNQHTLENPHFRKRIPQVLTNNSFQNQNNILGTKAEEIQINKTDVNQEENFIRKYINSDYRNSEQTEVNALNSSSLDNIEFIEIPSNTFPQIAFAQTQENEGDNSSGQLTDTSDSAFTLIQQIIKEEVSKEISECIQFLRKQFEKFKAGITELSVKNKFHMVSEFAKFEHNTFEEMFETFAKRHTEQAESENYSKPSNSSRMESHSENIDFELEKFIKDL